MEVDYLDPQPSAEDRLLFKYFFPFGGRAYHYTNQLGFLGILQNLEFWLTDLRFLNDSSEVEHAYKILRKSLANRLRRKSLKGLERKILKQIRSKITNDARRTSYVLCFSRKADDLNQWRSYASPGPGYCLGFDVNVLGEFTRKHGGFLGSCLYGEKQQKECVLELIEESLDDLDGYFPSTGPGEINEDLIDTRADRFVSAFGRMAPMFKNAAFEEENELRIVMGPPSRTARLHFRSGSVTIVPYRKASLKSSDGTISFPEIVYVKQTSDMTLTRLGAEHFLGSNQIRLEILEDSSIPYRETI